MSTDSANYPSDVQLLHTYLGERLQSEGSQITLDAALSGFQDYYRQLRTLRCKVREAIDSLDRNGGQTLDVDAVLQRVRKRLAERGVA
jgi:hypothetical protein